MGKGKNVYKGIVLGIVAILFLGIIGGGAYWIGTRNKSAQQTILPPEQTVQNDGLGTGQLTKTEYLCSQQPTVNGKTRVKDTMQTIDTYLANKTVYWVPQGKVVGSKLLTQTSGATTAGAYSTTAVTPSCGETYDVWVVDVANTNSYGIVRNVVVGTQPIDLTIETVASSALKGRVKDNSVDAYWQIAGGSNAYQNLAATWVNTSAGADIDAGTSGCHDLTIYMATQTSKTVFGKSDSEVAILNDAASTKWNEPTTSLGNNIKDGLHFDAYDLTAMADYEYAYQGMQFVDTGKSFSWKQCAVSSVDPGASDDLKIRAIAKGAVLDSRNNQAVRVAYFGNDASFTEIQGSTEEITLDEVA